MSIIKLSKQIPDPRVTGRTVHKMEHIIYITIAAVLAGCQTWDDIAEFGRTGRTHFDASALLLEKVSNQCSNNLHRALCLLSSVEYRINMVELFFLKNSSMMAITVSLTKLSRGDFLLFKFAITN